MRGGPEPVNARPPLQSVFGRVAACALALTCAFLLKWHYSIAGADQLRWILAPTAHLVETVTGAQFEFESGAGYLSREKMFLIAPGCAGINFLITSLLMLTLVLSGRMAGRPAFLKAAAGAYVATVMANTVRISIALQLQGLSWRLLDPERIHRLEGIVVYFAFLLLLFVLAEGPDRTPARNRDHSRILIPLVIYYGMALGVPLANGALSQGARFVEHALFTIVVPLPILLAYLYTLRGKSTTEFTRPA